MMRWQCQGSAPQILIMLLGEGSEDPNSAHNVQQFKHTTVLSITIVAYTRAIRTCTEENCSEMHAQKDLQATHLYI